MSSVILFGRCHSLGLLGRSLGLLGEAVGGHQRRPGSCSMLSLLRCLCSVCCISCYTLCSTKLVAF